MRLGSRALTWLGLVVGVAGLVADVTELGRIAEIASHIAMLGGTVLAAFGGAVVRPQNQRVSDPNGGGR